MFRATRLYPAPNVYANHISSSAILCHSFFHGITVLHHVCMLLVEWFSTTCVCHVCMLWVEWSSTTCVCSRWNGSPPRVYALGGMVLHHVCMLYSTPSQACRMEQTMYVASPYSTRVCTPSLYSMCVHAFLIQHVHTHTHPPHACRQEQTEKCSVS